MRGFFGIGIESVSKSMNVGGLFRTANAFGASFVFTINAQYNRKIARKVDTSDTVNHVPFYSFPSPESLVLPEGCDLVGVELLDTSADLPSFRHPMKAAYILGPERGGLSTSVLERCVYTVKIPTRFCINVGLAGAITMYDRMRSIGKYPRRPVTSRGKTEKISEHVFGNPITNKKLEVYRDVSPIEELDDYVNMAQDNE